MTANVVVTKYWQNSTAIRYLPFEKAAPIDTTLGPEQGRPEALVLAWSRTLDTSWQLPQTRSFPVFTSTKPALINLNIGSQAIIDENRSSGTMLHLLARDAGDMSSSRANEVIITGSVLVAVAFFGLLARLISARMKERSLNVGDALLVFSFSLNVFEVGLLIWATRYAALGHHGATATPQELVNYAKAFLTCSLVQPAILMSAKMSVLLLLYKIFAVRSFRIAVLAFMFIVMAWWISLTIVTFLICTPFDSNWGASPANCGNFHAVNVYAPIPWIITDFGILFMPMPMIRKLHLPMRQRVALAGLFLIGGLTCVISCIRFRYVFFSFKDVTWETVPLASWQLAESNITILCASLIASKPVAMYLMPEGLIRRIRSSFSSIRNSRSSRSGSTAGLSPQTTRDTVSTATTKKNSHRTNVIQKSSSVRLESVPKQMTEVDRTNGLGNHNFTSVPTSTYSVSVEGGANHLNRGNDMDRDISGSEQSITHAV